MRVIAGLVVVAAVCLALLWLFQRRLMYFPFGAVPAPADVGLPQASSVSFDTKDAVSLHGWFIPSDRTPARFTLVIFNGNAGNRSFRAPLAAALRGLGLQVLVFDYRGFGDNAGTPTEAGLIEDARAARQFLLGRPEVDPARLVFFGESLGTGVATSLAAEHPPTALILRSPFTSMMDLARLHYPLLPVRWLLRDRYPSIDRIRQISCPLLVIAGDRDSVVPVEQSRRLYDAAAEPKSILIVSDADHNDDALLTGRETIAAIDRFLKDVESRR